MDGYQQSVKAVMRAAAGRRLQGIIGPVAGILTVEKGYETAIETAPRLCFCRTSWSRTRAAPAPPSAS